jgi:hypothetical protein
VRKAENGPLAKDKGSGEDCSDAARKIRDDFSPISLDYNVHQFKAESYGAMLYHPRENSPPPTAGVVESDPYRPTIDDKIFRFKRRFHDEYDLGIDPA